MLNILLRLRLGGCRSCKRALLLSLLCGCGSCVASTGAALPPQVGRHVAPLPFLVAPGRHAWPQEDQADALDELHSQLSAASTGAVRAWGCQEQSQAGRSVTRPK